MGLVNLGFVHELVSDEEDKEDGECDVVLRSEMTRGKGGREIDQHHTRIFRRRMVAHGDERDVVELLDDGVVSLEEGDETGEAESEPTSVGLRREGREDGEGLSSCSARVEEAR